MVNSDGRYTWGHNEKTKVDSYFATTFFADFDSPFSACERNTPDVSDGFLTW